MHGQVANLGSFTGSESVFGVILQISRVLVQELQHTTFSLKFNCVEDVPM